MDIPTAEPTEIVAGASLKWRREDMSADYPAPTWSLSYLFVDLADSTRKFTVAAVADGAYFAVSVTPAVTVTYTPGTYEWAAYVTDGTDRYRVDHGTAKVLADLAALPVGYDGRSHARRVLDAIEAVIAGRASKDQESYQIAGRSLNRTPIPDLMKLRQTYRNEVRREEKAEAIRNGLQTGRMVLTRFGRG